MNNNIYIPQASLLQNIIHSIWQTDGITEFKSETIIPKGRIEIIFDFGEHTPLKAKLDNMPCDLAKCFINGFNTFPVNLLLPEQHTFLGVQFHPVAVKNIFGFPPVEFANLMVDLSLVSNSFNSLWHQLANKSSFSERVTVILEWIENKIFPLSPREQLLDGFLCDQAWEVKSVTQLSSLLCYSPRHLSRKIYELAGMNTEEMLLYMKYLRSLHFIHHTQLPLTKITYLCDFADQSHFIKSFKTFARMTPGEYRLGKSHLPGHIYENVR